MKKLISILLLFPVLSYTNINRNNRTQTTENVAESDIYDFDDEYVHDEAYIRLKTSELRQQLSDAYEQIDNIIVFDSLMESFENWKGTKYKWGGDSKKGIDCSALTRRIYDEVFNFPLRRVSIEQVQQGTKIKKDELKPGDIVFFRPKNRVNHVGVYVGNSLFINASSSQGVVISSLDNSYWKKYFKYGVRIDKARQTDEIN